LLLNTGKNQKLRATDGDIRLALKRLHNRNQLEEVNAPDEVVHRSQELLEKSISDIGDEFSEVEKLYPEYKIWVEEEYRKENEWQMRCADCQFWTPFVDEEQDSWCNKILFDDRSYPEPCAEYTKRVDGDMT